MSELCNNCDKSFDCYEPCSKIINWEPLPEEMRISDESYERVGSLDRYFGHKYTPNGK